MAYKKDATSEKPRCSAVFWRSIRPNNALCAYVTNGCHEMACFGSDAKTKAGFRPLKKRGLNRRSREKAQGEGKTKEAFEKVHRKNLRAFLCVSKAKGRCPNTGKAATSKFGKPSQGKSIIEVSDLFPVCTCPPSPSSQKTIPCWFNI